MADANNGENINEFSMNYNVNIVNNLVLKQQNYLKSPRTRSLCTTEMQSFSIHAL